MAANGQKFTFWAQEKVSELDCVDGSTTLYIF